VLGRKVLVTGSGPIGVLVAASARLAGASEVVVTDLFDEALAIAGRMGALFISEGTVKSHGKAIFAKMNVTSRTEAVADAARRGLLRL
jgi:threonine dehydrogenase-like Zn-dependent dehydrogenase